MIDITSKIVDATSNRIDWTPEDVRRALSALAGLHPDGQVDWEEGDEEWGRVISRDKEVAYVSARLPLAFVQADDEAATQLAWSWLGIVVIAVRDFDSPSISVDPSALANLTRRPLTEHVSYRKASMNEIWWATV